MSIESDDDLAGMREAGRITTDTLDVLQAHVADGITTAELDAIAAALLDRRTGPDNRADDQRRIGGSRSGRGRLDDSHADGSLAAHCEHTLMITKGAPLILAA